MEPIPFLVKYVDVLDHSVCSTSSNIHLLMGMGLFSLCEGYFDPERTESEQLPGVASIGTVRGLISSSQSKYFRKDDWVRFICVSQIFIPYS